MSSGAFAILNTLQDLIVHGGPGLFPSGAVPGPVRPANWAKPAVTTLTAQIPSVQPATTVVDDPTLLTALVPLQGAPAFRTTTPIVYVFDAILRATHHQELHITDNPIQTGANVADHAYRMPARCTLEIGMSDVMASYTPGQFAGPPSKSVNAYQTLVMLQSLRTPITLTTRLDTYANMLIEHIEADDTKETQYGLRCVVTLKQLFLATATAVSSTVSFGNEVPARPWTTQSTPIGTVQAAPVPDTLQAQHGIAASPGLPKGFLGTLYPNIPGAGFFSTNQLTSILGR